MAQEAHLSPVPALPVLELGRELMLRVHIERRVWYAELDPAVLDAIGGRF